MPKERKAELTFLYATRPVTEQTISISNKTKGDNAKSKKGRVVIHVWDTSSGPVLYFYKVS